MKYWITKWALTQGIIEVDEPNEPNRIYPEGYQQGFTVGKEAFDDLRDAKNQAEKMRIKKIISLRNKIDKLEKMSFQDD